MWATGVSVKGSVSGSGGGERESACALALLPCAAFRRRECHRLPQVAGGENRARRPGGQRACHNDELHGWSNDQVKQSLWPHHVQIPTTQDMQPPNEVTSCHAAAIKLLTAVIHSLSARLFLFPSQAKRHYTLTYLWASEAHCL